MFSQMFSDRVVHCQRHLDLQHQAEAVRRARAFEGSRQLRRRTR